MRRVLVLMVALLCWPAALRASEPGVPDALCLGPPYDRAETPQQESLRTLLRRTETALSPFPGLLAGLRDSGAALCLVDRTIGPRGEYDPVHNVLTLRTGLAPAEQVTILVHELRHLEQFARGYCPASDLAMAETAHAVFAMEADAQAITVLVAWHTRDAGDDTLWQALLSQPEYDDIAARFAAEMDRGADVSTAVSAAFDQWYESAWRVESYYIASCSDYLDRLDDSKRVPGNKSLGAEFLDGLCLLPGGEGYDCAPPPGLPR